MRCNQYLSYSSFVSTVGGPETDRLGRLLGGGDVGRHQTVIASRQ